jgi:hypothetical protein
VSFLAVYVKEAHPEDGWILTENVRSGISVTDPTTAAERDAVADLCATGLRLAMPMAVDGLDNAVTSAYGGWPDRLYLIGRDGRVAFQGGRGPDGFKPEELAAAIDEELS